MKSLIGVLMGVVIMLLVSSCATVPAEPLGEGELRLLGMQVPEMGNLALGVSYNIYFTFDADGKPEISRAVATGRLSLIVSTVTKQGM